ncbi:hypothetical protein B296_00004781 [Ensete ventricosum]|uniref:Uncharacterized protein n=1 Tax=Ensete ventricosum TaxID=4639 RepID=A0A426ZGJ1_ENSVE|nr:hypothetical protein B296_00004781 [Ensete ventricosum]
MGPQQQRRCIGDGLERKKTTALGRRQRLEAARWCDRAGDGCFKTWDVAGGFTGAVGQRRCLEPSDASSQTVQSNFLYFDGCEQEEGAQKSTPAAAARDR